MNLSKVVAVFTHSFSHFSSLYRHLFSIREIETEPILQWSFGASLFFFFVTFNRWIESANISLERAEAGTAVCWEYFQNCTDFWFLSGIGNGYSQAVFYMVLYGIMVVIVWCVWQKKWIGAHALLTLLLVWEVLVTLVLTFSLAAPYHYYHIALTAVLLFVPYKEFFLKLTFVAMYFLSVTTKFDGAWILGTYFSALRDGLPLLPDALIPFFTNAVIFMQTIGCWFLLSKRKVLQRLAFLYFFAFHLYSGVFVHYFYPSVALPPLLILFGPLYRHTSIPFSYKTLGGWAIIALLGVFQLLGFLAPGDRRITLEGNKFGMFMFEANHQCIVTVGTYTPELPEQSWEVPDGTACRAFYCVVKRSIRTIGENLSLREERFESGTAWNRCYPYEWWSRYHSQCDLNENISRISVRIDHSINGGPFYRIVDVPNICDIEYKAFRPNPWIKGPPEAPLIGYPVTNTYN